MLHNAELCSVSCILCVRRECVAYRTASYTVLVSRCLLYCLTATDWKMCTPSIMLDQLLFEPNITVHAALVLYYSALCSSDTVLLH